MRLTQASFSSGELSPLLHARADLARYHTGVAELTNFIVLPQGGVTRRAGIQQFGKVKKATKLIPFEYNSSDACLLEFGDEVLNVWAKISTAPEIVATLTTPYKYYDVKELHYVQSGNVIFLAHKDFPPYMLTRKAIDDWELKEFPFHGGAFIDGAEWNSEAKLSLSGNGDIRNITSNVDFFSEGLLGTLIKIEYTVRGNSKELSGTSQTGAMEVKGTLNVMTTGDWKGSITVQKSSDGGESWVTIRQYKRTDTSSQGQWDFSVAEEDSYVLYRVNFVVNEGTGNATVTTSGFLKSELYKISEVLSNTQAKIQRQKDLGFTIDDTFSGRISLWSIGAWGKLQGYPRTVTMYQDRLVFAGTKYQPQTIWLSRTGDYADFSVSDPLKDDDAVTITLAGSSADGIHNLLSTTDLLAFTNSGEWKITGSGDVGAITPSALTAHQQTNIGSADIQPILADGRIILVQAQGRKIFTLGYDLNVDGYTGSEISILSGHLFEDKKIVAMAYQKIPDNLLWFVLSDGTFVSCTYTPEHEVIGFAKHESFYELCDVIDLTGTKQTEIVAIAETENAVSLVKFTPRTDKVLKDNTKDYESILRTLRLTISTQNGSLYTNRKFVPRVIISALNSTEAWVAPGEMVDAKKNWERRRKISWDNVEYLTDADVQIDNGFTEYACVQVRSSGSEPLTIAAITPVIT